MKRRKSIGAIAFVLLLLLGFAVRYGTGISDDDWSLSWRVAYAIALCAAMFCAFYDRGNAPKKAWDYSPKRGFAYFLIGLFLFPLLIGLDAAFGADVGVARALGGALLLAILAGIVGAFTENVGV